MSQEQAKPQEDVLLLETAASAEQHRKERGDPEPMSPGKSGLGRQYDIGGVGDFAPVDTGRMAQPSTRDEKIEARVP